MRGIGRRFLYGRRRLHQCTLQLIAQHTKLLLLLSRRKLHLAEVEKFGHLSLRAGPSVGIRPLCGRDAGAHGHACRENEQLRSAELFIC